MNKERMYYQSNMKTVVMMVRVRVITAFLVQMLVQIWEFRGPHERSLPQGTIR